MTGAPNLAGVCIVLVRTQGPINLGMVARLCTNFGVSDLRFCAPQCGVDVPEARMFSTHGREILLTAPVFPDLSSAVADCGLVIGSSARLRDGELGSSLAPHQVPEYLVNRPAERWALVFGNEADGLTSEELRCCQAWVHLDTWGDNQSYNLANAVAMTLYSIASHGVAHPGEAPPAATRAHVESLHGFWMTTLERFHYFRRAERERFGPQLSRFLGRQHLTVWDVQMLRGMLAQFHWFAFGDRGDGAADGDVGIDAPSAADAARVTAPDATRR